MQWEENEISSKFYQGGLTFSVNWDIFHDYSAEIWFSSHQCLAQKPLTAKTLDEAKEEALSFFREWIGALLHYVSPQGE